MYLPGATGALITIYYSSAVKIGIEGLQCHSGIFHPRYDNVLEAFLCFVLSETY